MSKREFVFTTNRIGKGSGFSVEDSGAALIQHLESKDSKTLFIRLQSWDTRAWRKSIVKDQAHKDFNSLVGKKVTITVTVED